MARASGWSSRSRGTHEFPPSTFTLCYATVKAHPRNTGNAA
jgi:hypothetical protein